MFGGETKGGAYDAKILRGEDFAGGNIASGIDRTPEVGLRGILLAGAD